MVSKKMQSVVVKNIGNNSSLCLEEFLVPKPSDNEILIRVHAAGINRSDLLQRRGLYPSKNNSPFLGLEVSGEVIDFGKNSSQYFKGSRVMALVQGYGYSEFVVVDENNALPIPKNLSFIQAAAIPEAIFTVWSNLFYTGKLKKKETLLLHGGSSGIGTIAIQIAKAFGVNVVTTSGTDKKCNICSNLGSDLAINYYTKDFVKEILFFTKGKGVNVILDIIGGKCTEKNYEVVSVEGRIIQIAFLSGKKSEIDLSTLMIKRIIHTGSMLKDRDIVFKKKIREILYKKVLPLLRNGVIVPYIDSVFQFEDVEKAHNRLKNRDRCGKIILKISKGSCF